MILRMTPMIENIHRSFLPSFDKLSHGIYNSRRIVLILIAVLAIPAYTAQSMNDFLYGNDAVGASEERRYMRMMS